MIQRIQSVMLLLAGICLGLEFLFPFASSSAKGTGMLSDALYNLQDHVSLLGLTIAGIAIAMIAIFMFKNRSVQSKLVYLLILVSLALPIAAYLISSSVLELKNAESLSVGVGAFLPIASVVFSILAIRFIGKDENLVKSMDRLR